VAVPAGNFLMGSSGAEETRVLAPLSLVQSLIVRAFIADEHPQHSASIGYSFALGKYPVTWSEYGAFVSETGYAPTSGCTLYTPSRRRPYQSVSRANWRAPGFAPDDRDPVVCVSWQDAQAYIAWLNRKTGHATSDGNDAAYRLPSETEWEY